MRLGEEITYKTTCPYCGAQNDLVTQVAHDKDIICGPKAGDVATCLYCSDFAIYTHDGALRKPSAEEAAEISSDPRMVLFQSIRAKALANAKKKSG